MALLDNQLSHPLPVKYGREIFRCQVGSGLHGVTVAGYDDRDEMGMCIEFPECVIGLDKFEQYIYRTQPEGARSGYGDLDLTIYSLRKWMRLAMAGNPSVLLTLFAPPSQVVIDSHFSQDLRSNTQRFMSQEMAGRFLGYVNSQREQMLGLRGKKHTNRPELVAQFGYDTKFAFHMIRLGMQGVELLTTGAITLPMAEDDRAWLTRLRQGEFTKDAALAVAQVYEAQLADLKNSSELPAHPDRVWANQWLVSTYQHAWGQLSVGV